MVKLPYLMTPLSGADNRMNKTTTHNEPARQAEKNVLRQRVYGVW